jgi:hypothetical protein
MLKKENGAAGTIPVLPERARSECARSMAAVGIIPTTPLDDQEIGGVAVEVVAGDGGAWDNP